jgi:hypothetical protein
MPTFEEMVEGLNVQSLRRAGSRQGAQTKLTLPIIERSGAIKAWIIDDTGFSKKGRHSVGVARQYCGQLGKQDNSQIAVSLSLANHEASLPIACRSNGQRATPRPPNTGWPPSAGDPILPIGRSGQAALAHRAGLPI